MLPRWVELVGKWLPSSSAAGLLTLALAVVLGLLLGAIRVRGVRLGSSAVLFSALAFGQLGLTISPEILGFLRDLSLLLFVYAVGLQVGPGFLASLKAEGLRLNLLALAVVVLGAAMTAAVAWLSPGESAALSGLFSGALTSTPALAAGQDALRQVVAKPSDVPTAVDLAGLAYAVSYPFGLIGPILVIALLREWFKIKMPQERTALAEAQDERRPPIETMDIQVTRDACPGRALKNHPLLRGRGVVLCRLLRDGKMSVPTADTEIRVGDIYRAVGPRNELAELLAQLGVVSQIDLGKSEGDVRRMGLVVTRTAVLRRSLRELDLIRHHGVTIARIERAGIELTPRAELTLKFGDRVVAVGPESGLKSVEAELGNSRDSLNRPQLIPIFLGMVIGIMVGSIPLRFPGLSVPVRIGLAGGPMLAAIALSQLGNIGSVVWYMPVAANQLFRDFGLAVFLACIGFQSGGHFIQEVIHGGAAFILWGAMITVVPLVLVGWLARSVFNLNFLTLSGWVAGAMTSSPALLFAQDITASDAPAVAFATVAPLAMLSPVICAQLLVILVAR